MGRLRNINPPHPADLAKGWGTDKRFRGLGRMAEPNESAIETVAGREPDPIRDILHELLAALKCVHVQIACVLPRGNFKITHAVSTDSVHRTPERISKKLEEVIESMVWSAIHRNKAVAITPILLEAIGVSGLGVFAVAPVEQSIFEGYPAVVRAFAAADAPPFSQNDLDRLSKAASAIADAFLAQRRSRTDESNFESHVAKFNVTAEESNTPRGLLMLTPEGSPWIGGEMLANMDPPLKAQIAALAVGCRSSTSALASAQETSITDARGHRLAVRVIRHKSFSIPNDGECSHDQLIQICFIPALAEWKRLRASDFESNPEIARLIPALKFMSSDIKNQPGLIAIARAVHLSPFHFHRQFTELLGITPKDFLLAVQIDHARRLLSDGKSELSAIADACGFAHQSHFTSRFKQAIGLTPTQWCRAKLNSGSAQ